MRTTISVDENLLEAAKKRARKLGLTLGEFIAAALQRELARPKRSAAEAKKYELPVFHGCSGLQPGIDGTSNSSMLEALERGLPIEKLR